MIIIFESFQMNENQEIVSEATKYETTIIIKRKKNNNEN